MRQEEQHSPSRGVAAEVQDFAKFPPRQKPASFNLDAVMAQVTHHA
jgi:arylsulfatase